MSIEINLSGPHEQMLARLRETHGDSINEHLTQVVEAEVHESYQQLRSDN